MNHPTAAPFDLDQAYDFVHKNIFSLQPREYKNEHPGWPGKLGIEVEMLPLRRFPSTLSPTPLLLQGPAGSLAAFLEDVGKEQNWSLKKEAHGDSELLILVDLGEEDFLSFEPGGQLEFSSKPGDSFAEPLLRLEKIQTFLTKKAEALGIEFLQIGTNPWHRVKEIGLQMPKRRYKAMDQYFSHIGAYGARMMRQTCTIQVCLDFGASEAVFAKRYLGAQLIAPFTTALFAYSPFIDGDKTELRSFRSTIWRGVDRLRTGYPSRAGLVKSMDIESASRAYLDFALGAPVIFVKNADYAVPSAQMSFRNWLHQGYLGIKPNIDDFKEHLSLLFPEVRPRGFMELRAVDAQSKVWQDIPLYYYTSLLYDEKNLDRVISHFLEFEPKLESLLLHAAEGLSYKVLADGAKKLMEWALEGLPRFSDSYLPTHLNALKKLLSFYENFTAKGRTPADDLIDMAQLQGTPSLNHIKDLETRWMTL